MAQDKNALDGTTNQHQLYYQPKNVWVGDIMPFGKDGEFYIYHQRDTRNPRPMGEAFGWSLAKTSDFVTYADYGESLHHGDKTAVDRYVYSGTVFAAGDQLHAFYTGSNHAFRKVGRPSQTLLHAVSQDFIHWDKSVDALSLPAQPGYDIRNWRDPYVLWDDDKKEYLLILATRKGQDLHIQSGRLVKFTSKDLEHWQFGGDFWAPNLDTMPEMPDLFHIGDWWYLVYSEVSSGNKIHYRMSRDKNGPWQKPRDDAFDGRAYYAGRTATDGNRRVLFGWVPTKENNDDMSNYQWGGTFVPQQIIQRSDGTLGIQPIESIWRRFDHVQDHPALTIDRADGKGTETVIQQTGTTFRLSTEFKFSAGTSALSLQAYKNEASDESYEFTLDLDERMLRFDKSPNYPWYQFMDKGLQRPIDLAAGAPHQLKLIVDDTIMTLYIDDVALNVRVYHKFGQAIALSVTNGQAKFDHVQFSNSLAE